MPKLFLDVASVHLYRAGKACAQRMPREQRLAIFDIQGRRGKRVRPGQLRHQPQIPTEDLPTSAAARAICRIAEARKAISLVDLRFPGRGFMR